MSLAALLISSSEQRRFLDFSKACVSLNPPTVVHKMSAIGISSVALSSASSLSSPTNFNEQCVMETTQPLELFKVSFFLRLQLYVKDNGGGCFWHCCSDQLL